MTTTKDIIDIIYRVDKDLPPNNEVITTIAELIIERWDRLPEINDNFIAAISDEFFPITFEDIELESVETGISIRDCSFERILDYFTNLISMNFRKDGLSLKLLEPFN